jgi:prepilin-type N-terminal cleavage/methylation domain-containing protein
MIPELKHTHMAAMLLSPRRKPFRRAMTLIEILVAVALSSLVMGVVISFAVALQRSDRNVRSFAVRGERRSELADALRTDIRRATEASLPSEKILAIKLALGGELQYELGDGGCRRVAPARGDSPTQREFFAVGPAETWTLEQAAPGRRPLVMVTMQYAPKDKDSESRPAPLLVYAALGADLAKHVVRVSQLNRNESQQRTEELEQEVAEEARER